MKNSIRNTILRSFLACAVSSTALLVCVGMAGASDSAGSTHEIMLDESGADHDQWFNDSADVVLNMLGQDGTACTTVRDQTQCLSYTDVSPSPIRVGDDHASESKMYQCSALRGNLSGCVDIGNVPQESSQWPGGECASIWCSCTNTESCLHMLQYCTPNQEVSCNDGACSCVIEGADPN